MLEGPGTCAYVRRAIVRMCELLPSLACTRVTVRRQEIMVDYGGKYFQRDSSSDSEMQSDDEDFVPKQKRRKHGARAPLKRASRS